MRAVIALAVLGAAGSAWIWRGVVEPCRSSVREARHRAALAETALAQARQRRSQAVSKGNRTRAELERARVRETTAALREATRGRRVLQETLL